MKILQLNVWMGKVEGNLRRFLEKNNFDVICMQEVFASHDCQPHLAQLCFDLSRIQKASGMPFTFFTPRLSSRLADGHFEEGNLILSRIPFTHKEHYFVQEQYMKNVVFGSEVLNNRVLQIAKLENGFTVVNHHGFWRPDPIGDEETIKAFTKVGEIVKNLEGPVVMCGDLNIIHESPAMRPLDFLRDLTHENHIKTTLSGLKYDGEVACDHILASDKIEVKDFTVYPDLVSDHLALSAEVELA